MPAVIKIENISKQYRLGDVGTGALAHDINRWWHRLRGKEDPYLKIGETNDRAIKADSDYVWALKDINFDVQQGEVLGIIGRNGAGKSTLLKILSRTTTPTTGNIKIKGRIASLLEVGTGFHPELSGRDNIFLNGAILGMTKTEIKRKFDEIVDFAGVERYIDTPVKRYSSGMYVRLAFGVAAHLEPEILIVDEVLAVGDVEFQKKAMGKMKDVSEKEGRTVILVSHNMQAISTLCNSAILLEKGMIALQGEIQPVIEKYLQKAMSDKIEIDSISHFTDKMRIHAISINGSTGYTHIIQSGQPIVIEISGIVLNDFDCDMEIKFKDKFGNNIAFYSRYILTEKAEHIPAGPFTISRSITLPENINNILLKADLCISMPGLETYMLLENAAEIEYQGFATSTGKVFSGEGSGIFMIR